MEKWSDRYRELPPRLHYYGKIFKQRFMNKSSTLYDVQKQALLNIVKWFKDDETKNLTAVVVMPTGTGKTGVICCLPYMIGGAVEDGEISKKDINLAKGAILVITPGLDILHQLRNNLDRGSFLVERGLISEEDLDKNVLYSIFTVDRGYPVSELQGQQADTIILSNAQKWRKRKNGTPNYQDLRDDLFPMVIVDEAHHLPAPQWQDIVTKFQKHAKIVFFTATPNRANGKEITMDNAISTHGYAYQLSREKAIKDNLIRDVNFDCLCMNESAPTLALTDESATKMDEAAKIAERMVYAEEVVTQVVRRMGIKNHEHPLPNGIRHTAIIVARNIDEANAVQVICTRKLGIRKKFVKVVHSAIATNPQLRNEAIQGIKQSSTIEIVVIVNMLLEGFDHPPFSIAGIVTSIQSPLKFAQFVGRIQRLVPGEVGGVKADIITHHYFRQQGLFDDYNKPYIIESENESLDEDTDADVSDIMVMDDRRDFNVCFESKEEIINPVMNQDEDIMNYDDKETQEEAMNEDILNREEKINLDDEDTMKQEEVNQEENAMKQEVNQEGNAMKQEVNQEGNSMKQEVNQEGNAPELEVNQEENTMNQEENTMSVEDIDTMSVQDNANPDTEEDIMNLKKLE